MALICINPYADYAANSSVYQPGSKEAIFNSLEKHTLWKDFQQRLYIMRLFEYMLSMQRRLGEIQSSSNELLISAEEGERLFKSQGFFISHPVAAH